VAVLVRVFGDIDVAEGAVHRLRPICCHPRALPGTRVTLTLCLLGEG
jgi:predicted RNA polymerase sigma factor